MFGGYPGQQQRGSFERSAHGQQQLQPYEDFGRQRAASDPFGMMDDMMMPFGGLGSRRSGRGGSLFDSMFGQMGQMMEEMESMAMGGGGQMMSSSMSSGGRGGGSFSCQTFSFSSVTGPDGQVHTEKYSSSAVGDRSRNMHEVQQAYSNSRTGVDKMSLERQLEGRGRKMVKERQRDSGEERQTEMFRGMTEDDARDFDDHWRQRAAPSLPQHQLMGGGRMMLGDPNIQGRAHQAHAALPSSDGYAGYPQARPSSSNSQWRPGWM
eukprot:TRINITY_DN53377_c0_g1_i1.p1 TRINITY_DN53377_c0_g1~~TRINITY_DN53377_c0_g1_i1.p1  ORF type:complete len:265 (+),score=55.27 TRINITY_DN53377_c0_g1_i1:91-885(+)